MNEFNYKKEGNKVFKFAGMYFIISYIILSFFVSGELTVLYSLFGLSLILFFFLMKSSLIILPKAIEKREVEGKG